MLFIVLLLVLAALALLVTALITANSLWAWISIGLSVLAGVLLVADYLRRRAQRKRAETPGEPAAEAVTEESAEDEAQPEPGAEEPPAAAAPGGDPAEEKTSPADAEVVAELDVEVVVVDEYPRYHVTECPWLTDRDTIPIAVKEARDLGFTPCARCTPDAKLAQAHRTSTS